MLLIAFCTILQCRNHIGRGLEKTLHEIYVSTHIIRVPAGIPSFQCQGSQPKIRDPRDPGTPLVSIPEMYVYKAFSALICDALVFPDEVLSSYAVLL